MSWHARGVIGNVKEIRGEAAAKQIVLEGRREITRGRGGCLREVWRREDRGRMGEEIGRPPSSVTRG